MPSLTIEVSGTFAIAVIGINGVPHAPVGGKVTVQVNAGVPQDLVIALTGAPGFSYSVNVWTDPGCHVVGTQAIYPCGPKVSPAAQAAFIDTLTVTCP